MEVLHLAVERLQADAVLERAVYQVPVVANRLGDQVLTQLHVHQCMDIFVVVRCHGCMFT